MDEKRQVEAAASGREIATYLILSELLGLLGKKGLVDKAELHGMFCTAGNRLSCIRETLTEMGTWAESKEIEREGQRLINLFDDDVHTTLRHIPQNRTWF